MKKPIVHCFYNVLYFVSALLSFPWALSGIEVPLNDQRIQSEIMEHRAGRTELFYCDAFSSPVPAHAEKLCMLEVFRTEIFMRELRIVDSAPASEEYCERMGDDFSPDDLVETLYLRTALPLAQFVASSDSSWINVTPREPVRFDRRVGASIIKNLLIRWDKSKKCVDKVSFDLTWTIAPSEAQRHAEVGCKKYLKRRKSDESLDDFLLRLLSAGGPDWIVFFVRCMPLLVDKLNFEKPCEDNSTDEEASDDDETW